MRATSWHKIPPHSRGPLAIWKCGLGISGAAAAGTLAGLWVLRGRGVNIPIVLDAAAPVRLLAQAIGRIGNYFNEELFGGPTTLPWDPRSAQRNDPPGIPWYATFHPLFSMSCSGTCCSRRTRLARPAALNPRPGAVRALRRWILAGADR